MGRMVDFFKQALFLFLYMYTFYDFNTSFQIFPWIFLTPKYIFQQL